MFSKTEIVVWLLESRWHTGGMEMEEVTSVWVQYFGHLCVEAYVIVVDLVHCTSSSKVPECRI